MTTLRQLSTNVNWYVEKQISEGTWRQEIIQPEIVGLSRQITVFRASRKTNLIAYDWHGDRDTFCPPIWWDLAIGSGACGLGCRSCFLMLTHRIRRDPWRHLLYDNYDDFYRATAKWLLAKDRKTFHTLGVGIDRSDSLLYEGITGHVRRLAPLFSNSTTNPQNCKLILLTKSANAHYLKDISLDDRRNVVVTFSLNPEQVADLWEGKWPDGERITPPIYQRLEAALFAQKLGFEVRVRIDPILTPLGWEEYYAEFVGLVRQIGINFRYWTLGTYREKNTLLDHWRERWGLPAMEWEPTDLVKEGTHRHLSTEHRVEIYRTIASAIRREFPEAKVSLCKETHEIRKFLRLCNADCNCLQ
jgi:hypothetical protein